MLFSVITPVHALSQEYLINAYLSLRSAECDFEWIIVENGGGVVPSGIKRDNRVVVVGADCNAQYNSVGYLKGLAASRARGDVIVELDADDLLTHDALPSLHKAFSDKNVQMAYSNSAEFYDKTWKSNEYGVHWGWRSRSFFYQGYELREMIAWEPSAHMMRFIFWAPNHIRAWRTSAYREVGGHDASLKIGDDHDLCCRFYLKYGAQGIRHINKCLYLYRLHEGNSCRLHNEDVQKQTLQNYIKYSRGMFVRWAQDEGLRLLDLGGRFNVWNGFETVDLRDADIICDLNEKWPIPDNSVGVLRASHIFEHLKNPIHSMNEAYRVLAPGGFLLVEVPSTDGRGAFQDPTHVSFWNENTFWYYTNREFARFIRPAYEGRFQVSRVVTYFPTEFERTHNIPIVQADLIALKSPYDTRPVGEVLI